MVLCCHLLFCWLVDGFILYFRFAYIYIYTFLFCIVSFCDNDVRTRTVLEERDKEMHASVYRRLSHHSSLMQTVSLQIGMNLILRLLQQTQDLIPQVDVVSLFRVEIKMQRFMNTRYRIKSRFSHRSDTKTHRKFHTALKQTQPYEFAVKISVNFK